MIINITGSNKFFLKKTSLSDMLNTYLHFRHATIWKIWEALYEVIFSSKISMIEEIVEAFKATSWFLAKKMGRGWGLARTLNGLQTLSVLWLDFGNRVFVFADQIRTSSTFLDCGIDTL